MEPGRVIEFIEGRSFLTASVTRVKGAKLQVISENDREMNVSVSRVLHTEDGKVAPAASRDAVVKALKEISALRDKLSTELDLEELWELLEGEGEEFAYDFLAELVWPGPAAGDQVVAVLRAIFADGVYFKMRPEAALRHSTEKVEQIVQTRAREQERERELNEGGEWLAEVWADQTVEGPACAERIIRILTDMAIYGSEASEFKWGQKVLEKAGLTKDPLTPFKVLVKLGVMGRHENLDLVRKGISVDFSPEILKEAETLASATVWQEEDRRDLTGLEAITVDSGGARDFDDAVSLELVNGRMILGVHIADVSGLILPGSVLDQEALSRAVSIYMPDRRLPMLPEILSEGCLSLKAGEVRPAFSLRIEMTPEAEILGYEFFPSLLNVKRQLSYQEVDSSVDHDLSLGRMFKLSQALKAKRVEQGALILPLPKLNVFLTPEGEIGVNLTLWENPGRSMISEFMILANHLAARFLSEQGAPCYYRVQDEPSERVIPGDSDCQDLFPCLKQRKFLSRVEWIMEPKPHNGMGLNMYTNLTSPLRRYIDLIIQRQVRSLIKEGRPLYDEEAMGDILTLVEVSRKKAAWVQNQRRRYWLIRYLEVHMQEEYEALVLERFPHRWRIFIIDLMLDADLPLQSGQTIEPGQTITVRVRKADAREDTLRFALV